MFITDLTELWIVSKIRIAATPTNVYDHTYAFLHVYNSNFRRLIVNMQNYAGAVVDVRGSGGDTNF
jgi:hypothetical protein